MVSCPRTWPGPGDLWRSPEDRMMGRLERDRKQRAEGHRARVGAVEHLGLASTLLLYANAALAPKKPHSGTSLLFL